MYMRTFIEIVAVLIFLIIIGTMQAKDEASKQEQALPDVGIAVFSGMVLP